jgi:branched-chain amino acid transport system substrate-binding protein
MRPSTRFATLLALACLPLLAAACGGDDGGAAAGGSDGGGTVKVAALLSTSGDGAVFGVDQKQGIDIAVKQINAAGGIDGRKIEVTHEDTAYDKTQAQSVMAGVVPDDDILAVIGPTSSAEAFAADPAAVGAGLPVVAISNGADGIPQIGEYVHRIAVPEDRLLPRVAALVDQQLSVDRAAILYAQNDPFATTGSKGFRSQLEKDGVTVTNVVPYDSEGTVDFKPQLQRIKGEAPDVIFVAAKANDGAVILRQARQVGLDVPVVGNLAFTSPALIKAAGAGAEGLVVGALWDSSATSDLNRQFIDDYKAAYNRDPSALSATAFNAISVIKQALETSKDFSREGVQKGLEAMDGYEYLGVPVSFVDAGDGLRDAAVDTPVLLQVTNGELKPAKF